MDGLRSIHERCASLINISKNICVLTGAGVSTNCGIPDFRSKNGWYDKEPDDILSFSNFMKNPREVYDFLYRYYNLINVEPSLTHEFFAELERDGKNVNIITQNIDKLHQRAGSSDVIEYHGGLDRSNCIMCGREYEIEKVLNSKIHEDDFDYICSCAGLIKPNITLFGEDILEYSFAKKEISRADMIIIIGTSMQVSPFNKLVYYASLGTPIIVINKTSTVMDLKASIVINSDCDEAVSLIREEFAKYENIK